MAARKIKRIITLAQCPRWTSDDPQGYVYRVLSLQNALEPPVGATLAPEEIAAMIDIGWTVNIKDGK